MATSLRTAVIVPRTPVRQSAGEVRLSPDLLALGAIVAMSQALRYGTIAVGLYYLFAGALIVVRPMPSIREIIRFSPLLILPVFAIISTLWSTYPQATMRGGLELFGSVVAIIMICRAVRPERLLLIAFLCFLGNALLWLPAIPETIASHLPLGGQGVKNTQGYLGYMLFALALAVMCDARQRGWSRVSALCAAPYALLIVFLSQSGSATASVAITLAVFPPLALLGVFGLPTRVALLIFAAGLLLISCLFLGNLMAGVDQFRSVVLQKDATLTGRTYLWDFAEHMAQARPWLGYGSGAFWQHGNIDAEGLWRRAGIADRAGFNFHNELLETRVALGWIGVGMLCLTAALVALVALGRQLVRPSVAAAGLITLMLVSYIRSYVEDGLLSGFSFITLFWFASVIYALVPEPLIDSLSFGSRRRTTGPERLPDQRFGNGSGVAFRRNPAERSERDLRAGRSDRR